MDANDIELVSARDSYDFDEVYPGDDLHESKPSYHPQIRKQNRIFITGFSCLLLLMAAALGYRVFYMPRAETELEFMRGGTNDQTVNNTNNEHAKVSEALMSSGDKNNNDHDIKKKKKEGRPVGNAASQWAANNANSHKNQTNSHPTVPPTVESNHEEPENDNGNESDNDNVPADSNSNNEEPETENKHDFEQWHKIKVTKADGVMYEIVDTLVHDPTAFL